MNKYELKELWDITAQDRSEIYEYAVKRSNEIVFGQNLEVKKEPVSMKFFDPRSPEQLAAYNSLRWLLDPKREREGRSLAIAMALLDTALYNLDVYLPVFDHVDVGRHNRQRMVSLVRGLVEEKYPGKCSVISDPAYTHLKVVIRKKEEVDDE